MVEVEISQGLLLRTLSSWDLNRSVIFPLEQSILSLSSDMRHLSSTTGAKKSAPFCGRSDYIILCANAASLYLTCCCGRGKLPAEENLNAEGLQKYGGSYHSPAGLLMA
ncbi:hypothetical protein OPV22_034570 [Ensete ventricosum]|uniref:Uncharacterized protein n=1 Tax=Ensete ventricosum TaxID=4639 RepID=A0AAV8PXC0_ENSVE|nr:hypothetical protein OPV22_034570 [Ensete ventricosum]